MVEGDRLDRAGHAREILSTFYGHSGTQNCGNHGGESEICCGNELMRQVLEEFSDGDAAERIPYDEDPNAKPDEAAIRAHFQSPDPEKKPNMGFGTVSREVRLKQQAEVAEKIARLKGSADG